MRGSEDAIGQSFGPDGVKVEGSFLGASLGVTNTRDGDIILSPGAGLDPKSFFVDLPKSIAKGTNIWPSGSFTAQKILRSGNIQPSERLKIFEGDSVSFSAGYRLYGGLDITNAADRTKRTYTASVGVGSGITPGGISRGFHLFRGCWGW